MNMFLRWFMYVWPDIFHVKLTNLYMYNIRWLLRYFNNFVKMISIVFSFLIFSIHLSIYQFILRFNVKCKNIIGKKYGKIEFIHN